MAIIKAPNDQYTGVSASVFFVNGEGETDDPKLIEWFKEKGYTVIEKEQEQTEKPQKEQEEPEDEQPENEGNQEEQEPNEQGHEYVYDDITADQIKGKLDDLGIEYKARDGKKVLFDLLVNADEKKE